MQTETGLREPNVFDHIRIVVEYRWTILLVCFLVTGVAGVVSYLWPPRYVATTSVAPPIEASGGNSGLGMGLLGGASLLRKVMDTGSVADMYVGILESRAVTDAIIDRFDCLAAQQRHARNDSFYKR